MSAENVRTTTMPTLLVLKLRSVTALPAKSKAKSEMSASASARLITARLITALLKKATMQLRRMELLLANLKL